MSDQAHARLLTQLLTALLCRHGLYTVRSRDTAWWADMLESRGEFINSAFRPDLHPDPAECLALHRLADGRFVGAIAWRAIETADYVQDRMRTGRQWIPEPAAVGWRPYDIPAAPLIAGRVHDRGGLYVEPASRGDRLSWFLTGLQWAIALGEGVNFVVSQTLPKVSASILPRMVYGYENFQALPRHDFPWRSEGFAPALVWSDTQAIRHEVARRLRYLRQRHAQDLDDAARGYQRYQEAMESPQPTVLEAAVNE